MRANINLEDFQEVELTEGIYEVRCAAVEHRITTKGGDATNLRLTIEDGPDTQNGDSPQGESVFTMLNWPNPTMKNNGRFAGIQLRKACEAANVPFTNGGFDEEDFLNATFAVRIKNEDYEGSLRPKVVDFMPLT